MREEFKKITSVDLVVSGCDRNLNVTALLELHINAILVSQGIYNAEMPMVGPVHGNLSFFRVTRTWRNDFGDGAGHGDTWLFWNSCRFGDARFRHFLLHAGTDYLVRFFMIVCTWHGPSFLCSMGDHHGIETELGAVSFRT